MIFGLPLDEDDLGVLGLDEDAADLGVERLPQTLGVHHRLQVPAGVGLHRQERRERRRLHDDRLRSDDQGDRAGHGWRRELSHRPLHLGGGHRGRHRLERQVDVRVGPQERGLQVLLRTTPVEDAPVLRGDLLGAAGVEANAALLGVDVDVGADTVEELRHRCVVDGDHGIEHLVAGQALHEGDRVVRAVAGDRQRLGRVDGEAGVGRAYVHRGVTDVHRHRAATSLGHGVVELGLGRGRREAAEVDAQGRGAPRHTAAGQGDQDGVEDPHADDQADEDGQQPPLGRGLGGGLGGQDGQRGLPCAPHRPPVRRARMRRSPSGPSYVLRRCDLRRRVRPA